MTPLDENGLLAPEVREEIQSFFRGTRSTRISAWSPSIQINLKKPPAEKKSRGAGFFGYFFARQKSDKDRPIEKTDLKCFNVESSPVLMKL